MKVKYIVIALLVLGLGALIVYRISENKKVAAAGPGKGGPGKPGGAMPATRVSGVVVQPRQFANSLSVSGTIEPNEQVQLRAEVPGVVRSISFEEGARVNKGQVLLKIDDSELRAQLSQVTTQKNLAAENERRAKLLLEKEAISREEYDVARATLQSAQAQVQLIQAQLAKTTLRAPFSGTVGLRNVSVGGFLSPDVVVANLVSTDPVKITFSVPEKYANQVSEGTRFTFTVAGSQKKYSATVYAVEPSIETETRTLQLRARAANPDNELKPGSFANIEFPLSIVQNALLIPTQAVIPIQNGKKVFVSRNGKASEALIETSTRTESSVLVTSGLNPGDTVLTTGIMALKEGTPVKVKLLAPKETALTK